MSRIYNRKSEKELRQKLRNEPTYAERILWRSLRNQQIADCRFRRQYSVGPFVLDFYAPEIRLAIEVDGPTHDLEEVKARDERRQRYIQDFDIEFLRFTDNEVIHYHDTCLQTIEAAVLKWRADLGRSDWFGRRKRLEDGAPVEGEEER